MSKIVCTSLRLDVPDAGPVTARLDAPADPVSGAPAVVLAHGANNNLDYPLLAQIAQSLAATIAATVIRFNFPYVERGAEHSTDSAETLLQAFRQAYRHLAELTGPGDAPLFVGGKSLGGRTAAELVSRRPEGDGVKAAGLIEFGYPLHAPGHKDRVNLKPLRHIDIPSLFFVGTSDPFCDLELLRPVLPTLLAPARLHVVEGGDHSLLLPRSSGKAADAAYPDVAAKIADFITEVVADPTR
jgi:hypothetical protein